MGEPLSIPPRWLHCPRKSQLIASKFLAFKTPLKETYDGMVSEDCRWTVGMLLASIACQRLNLGMWIDLTNTSRFYDRGTVEDGGVSYVKLSCRGHNECPSKEQTDGFIRLCAHYFSKKPLDVIGVHCTHGFNRTGFLICAYLVEKLDWSIDAAVGAFSLSRPPGIYKGEYIQELFRRYGDADSVVPTPPPLPSWCFDDQDGVDDDGYKVGTNGHSVAGPSGPPQKRQRTEFSAADRPKKTTFMEGRVLGGNAVTDDRRPAMQVKAQEMCRWKKKAFPGSQPVSMDTKNLRKLMSRPYMVSWKADGTRYLMLIKGLFEVFMIDRDNDVFQIEGLTFPRRKNPQQHVAKTLLDGEMIIDVVEGKNVPRYLAYDIIQFEGDEVGWTDFRTRLLCIKKEIISPRIAAMQAGQIDKRTEPFSVRAKDFWDIVATRKLLDRDSVFQRGMSHELDGLIFQPAGPNDTYVPGTCVDTLKWKPPHLNSIDFRLKLTKDQRPGMLPELRGLLFVTGKPEPFAELTVTNEIRDKDNKIIECKFDGAKNSWVFMRERMDKSFPNSVSTALSVCDSIKEPVTQELLLRHIDSANMPPPAARPVRQ